MSVVVSCYLYFMVFVWFDATLTLIMLLRSKDRWVFGSLYVLVKMRHSFSQKKEMRHSTNISATIQFSGV
jgi:hypothetical protein